MYNILVNLMNEKKVSPYKVAKDTGITQATLSRWKTGKVSPSLETLQTLADYFNVSVDYLLGKDTKEKAPAKAGANDVGIWLDDIQDKLRSGESIMFNGLKLSPESAAALAASIEAVDAMTAKLAEQSKGKKTKDKK